jgi:hypothetical protein
LHEAISVFGEGLALTRIALLRRMKERRGVGRVAIAVKAHELAALCSGDVGREHGKRI